MNTRLSLLLGAALLALPLATHAQGRQGQEGMSEGALPQPAAPPARASQRGNGLDQPGMQERSARQADSLRLGTMGPEAYLRQAQEAVRRNRLAEANELLERAETRAMGGMPELNSSELMQRSAGARTALANGNRTAALQEIAQALQMSERSGLRGDMMTGGGRGTVPGQGGPGTGTVQMRESGPGGTWRSPAEFMLIQSSPATPGLGPQGTAPGSGAPGTGGSYGTQGVPGAGRSGGNLGVGAPPGAGTGAGVNQPGGTGMPGAAGRGMTGGGVSGSGGGGGGVSGGSLGAPGSGLGTAPGAGGPLGGGSGGR